MSQPQFSKFTSSCFKKKQQNRNKTPPKYFIPYPLPHQHGTHSTRSLWHLTVRPPHYSPGAALNFQKLFLQGSCPLVRQAWLSPAGSTRAGDCRVREEHRCLRTLHVAEEITACSLSLRSPSPARGTACAEVPSPVWIPGSRASCCLPRNALLTN